MHSTYAYQCWAQSLLAFLLFVIANNPWRSLPHWKSGPLLPQDSKSCYLLEMFTFYSPKCVGKVMSLSGSKCDQNWSVTRPGGFIWGPNEVPILWRLHKAPGCLVHALHFSLDTEIASMKKRQCSERPQPQIHVNILWEDYTDSTYSLELYLFINPNISSIYRKS